MKKILALSLFLSGALYAQGPAGVSAHLSLWLAADMGVYEDDGITASSIGDPVQEWHDQSTNNFVFQSTSTARPTLHAEGLDFDGTNDVLTLTGGVFASGTSYGESEVFIVKTTDEIKDETVFHQVLSPSHYGACLPCLDENAYFEAGDANPLSGQIYGSWGGVINTQYIWSMYTDNNNTNDTPLGQSILRDGTPFAPFGFTTSSSVIGSTNDFTIGNISDGGSRYMNGKIAELIIYRRRLGDTDKASIMNYLAAKYQVAVSGSINFNGSYSGGSGVSGAPNTSDISKAFIVSSGNATITANATVASLGISNGATLTLAPNVTLTVDGATYISGAEALVLQSDATGTANFIDSGDISYKDSGSIKVERYIPYVVATFPEGYHYISSPVNNHTIFEDTSGLYYYDETTLTWIHHSNFTNFTNGRGYAIRYTSTTTKNFTGPLNTGNINIPITYTDNGASSYDHFNLIGNPYPSSISADDVVDNHSLLVNPTLYFWNGEDYASYNTTLNAGTAGSIGSVPDNQIAVGQGFYIDAKTEGTLTLSNSMRGNDSDIFYKGASYPQVRIMLYGENGKSDLLLTGHSLSTFGVDDYDTKHLNGNSRISLTSKIDQHSYDIQSVPKIDATIFDLEVNAIASGEIRFVLEEMKALNGMHVYLEDSKTGRVVDISQTPYNTYINDGMSNNRFKLRISKEKVVFSAWIDNGKIKMYLEDAEMISARLISLDGKTIATTTSMQFSNWELLSTGIYLLEISTNQNKYVQKIVK